MQSEIVVIGGGLAGCEAAWQVAQAGVRCTLYEMRPAVMSPAHRTDRLAELVCSNSLGSLHQDNALGLLKAELDIMGSLLLSAARTARVPAGRALAVDRAEFSAQVEQNLGDHPLIELRRQEVTAIPGQGTLILATGPLTSAPLMRSIEGLVGAKASYFYDAAAPLVHCDSICPKRTFRAGRHGDGDYINCPLTPEEYHRLVNELRAAQRVVHRDFETRELFGGCLPVEEIARRGVDTLRFGPLRPIGLIDPLTGERPYAVVQLRQDDRAGQLYNLVGFQTNLTWPEQKRIFRLIPGLEQAKFARYGVMHRNTFVNAPCVIAATLECRLQPDLFFAGQLVGGEGYVTAITTGLVAGINAARRACQEPLLVWPPDTLTGALLNYLANAGSQDFQPINPNFGLLPPVSGGRKTRREKLSQRALRSLRIFWAEVGKGRIL